jgi:hypothetical protein
LGSQVQNQKEKQKRARLLENRRFFAHQSPSQGLIEAIRFAHPFFFSFSLGLVVKPSSQEST